MYLGPQFCAFLRRDGFQFTRKLILRQWANAAGLVASEAQFEDIYGLDTEVCGYSFTGNERQQ